MKKNIISVMLVGCFLLTACNSRSIGIIGGADGPTSIIVAEKQKNIGHSDDVEMYFRENYVNEHTLPVLDVNIENHFISDDRTLVLDDTVENNIEFIIYEYYRNRMAGLYTEVKDAIAGKALLSATENEEKDYLSGIYYSKIILDEIELVDKDDLDEIAVKNKQAIIETLNDLKVTEFAIVEVDKNIKHNEKSLGRAPQVGDGEITRYYLLGKIDETYKIIEVYWEGLL